MQRTYAYLDYRHQEDEGVASRGSIAMKTAIILVSPGSMGLRFEVHSAPTRHSTATEKWYLKANHPLEASRWIQALHRAMECAKRDLEEQKSIESDAPSHYAPSTSTSTSTKPHRISAGFLRRKGDGSVSNAPESAASSVVDEDGPDTVAGSPAVKEPQLSLRAGSEQDNEPENEISSFAESTEQLPPHSGAFELQGNSLVAQAELATQILGSLAVAPDASPKSVEMKKVVDDTVAGVYHMLSEYVQMVHEREEWWKKKLEREHERQNVWEESLQAVVKEGELLERELRKSVRRRSRIEQSYVTVSSESPTLKRGPSRLLSQGTVVDETGVIVETPRAATGFIAEPVKTPTSVVSLGTARPKSLIVAKPPKTEQDGGNEDEGEDVDTDEEDEFFDAIDSNSLPNLVVNQALTSHAGSLPPEVSTEQYAGYRDLRTRLAITSDDRPPMSLWAVLKNSIGKDLTKISFPVFFNEPTSMLQRMVSNEILYILMKCLTRIP